MGNHEGVGPVLPTHTKKKYSPQLWPSYQLVVCGFLRLSSQSFSNEKHRQAGRGKRNTKKQDMRPLNSSKYSLKAQSRGKDLQREEVFWFHGGPKLILRLQSSEQI